MDGAGGLEVGDGELALGQALLVDDELVDEIADEVMVQSRPPLGA